MAGGLRQAEVIQESLGTDTRVERTEYPAKVTGIVHQTVRRPAPARHEGQCRDLVAQRKDVLLGSCFILTIVRRQNPNRISVLAPAPKFESHHRFVLALCAHL